MGWFTSNTTIRFRLGHNLSIDVLLEDPNLGYSLEKFDADLTRDKYKVQTLPLQCGWVVLFPNRQR